MKNTRLGRTTGGNELEVTKVPSYLNKELPDHDPNENTKTYKHFPLNIVYKLFLKKR